MSTRIVHGETYTNDGRILRAVKGYVSANRPSAPTWVQQDSGLGWYSCELIRATGTTWRVRWANGDEVEVLPRTVRMRIG